MSLPHRKRFNGNVFLSGKHQYSVITPRIDDERLDLFRMEQKQRQGETIELIASVGPHFETWCITTNTLVHTINETDYLFSGAHLGTKYSCWGYMKADIGGETRAIEELVFRKTFFQNHTEFDVSGKCGPLLFPNNETKPDLKPSFETFHVQFQVPDEEFLEWCSCGERFLAQKTHYLAKC